MKSLFFVVVCFGSNVRHRRRIDQEESLAPYSIIAALIFSWLRSLLYPWHSAAKSLGLYAGSVQKKTSARSLLCGDVLVPILTILLVSGESLFYLLSVEFFCGVQQEGGEFKKAAPEEIAKRRIVKARRGGAAAPASDVAHTSADQPAKPAAATFSWATAATTKGLFRNHVYR